MSSKPATFIEWFEQGLRAKLASLPNDAARAAHVVQMDKVWSERARRYSLTIGASECPHPDYGMPTATDFHGFLAAIDAEQRALAPLIEAA